MSAKGAAGTVQSWHCSIDFENAIRLRQNRPSRPCSSKEEKRNRGGHWHFPAKLEREKGVTSERVSWTRDRAREGKKRKRKKEKEAADRRRKNAATVLVSFSSLSRCILLHDG